MTYLIIINLNRFNHLVVTREHMDGQAHTYIGQTHNPLLLASPQSQYEDICQFYFYNFFTFLLNTI